MNTRSFGRGALALALALGALGTGCNSNSNRQPSVDRDTLTRRQKDSIIAESPLPGSSVVGKALDASDAAKARAQAHDTIR